MKSIKITKLILFFALLSINFSSTQAQFVTIPDPNFVVWLTNYYPTCMSGNQMDTTCSGIVNMFGVYLLNDGIVDLTGIQYLDSLKELKLNYNPITSLPNLPKTLIELDCGANELTILPNLPNTLVTLNCAINQLTNLPTLPSSLRYLYCFNNPLAGLPALPDSLIELNCAGANLSAQLTLPSQLVKLVCTSCQLTTMPPLPHSLAYLQCNLNALTTLPTLYNKLALLHCQNNQLTSLPALPNSLTNFWCDHNQLTSLPTLPNHLTHLVCTKNLLTSLPPIPSTVGLLRIDSNFIQCLPILPQIVNGSSAFKISGNLFTCVPNYIPSMDSATLTLPICHDNDIANNPFGCGSASGISGQVYIDGNNDCAYNSGETGLQNIQLKFYNPFTNQFGATYSQTSGAYNYPCITGTHLTLLDTLNKPYKTACLYPGIDSLVLTSSNNQFATNVNFDIVCKSGIDVGTQSILVKSGSVFPGQEHSLQIVAGDMSNWFGLNCASGFDGQVQVTVTGPLIYIGQDSSALVPTISGNIYTYLIQDFGAVNSLNDFQLNFLTDTTAQGGDQICVHVEVISTSGDINSSNNTTSFCYNVLNSYDPNYKEVYPKNVLPGFEDWLTYTIHFQNTGTAPAINISLLDTLDANLNMETFEVINYSHYNSVTLMDGILDFRFPNILLPDSASDLAGSQGFVQYRIKPIANLPDGTQIKNKANIYFDFNAPITTNTTENNFITTVGMKENKQAQNISIYPNPSNGIYNLSAQAQIEVYNIIGEIILNSNNAKTIDLRNEPHGIYFVKVNGMMTKKIIKN